MEDEDRTAKRIDAAIHELTQHLQVIVTAIGAIERREGERHADLLEPAKRALKNLDRGLEELAALAQRGSRSASD